MVQRSLRLHKNSLQNNEEEKTKMKTKKGGGGKKERERKAPFFAQERSSGEKWNASHGTHSFVEVRTGKRSRDF
jgi:hypothetical protein